MLSRLRFFLGLMKQFFFGWILVQQQLSELSLLLNRFQVNTEENFRAVNCRLDRLERCVRDDLSCEFPSLFANGKVLREVPEPKE